jgi:hypothetical protein
MSKIKKIYPNLVAIAISILAIYFLFFLYKPQAKVEEPIFYSSEECKKVDFDIKEISCSRGVIKMFITNTGSIELNGTFLTIINTPDVQAFIGGSMEDILKINQTLPVYFDFGKTDVINRIEIVFQPCPFSNKVFENISISC